MWSLLKKLPVELAGVSKDALHVHIGLIAFFGSAFLLKRSPANLLPWLVVLGLELVNETMDLSLSGRRQVGIAQWGESLRDLFNTMLWPSILMLAARARQRRQQVLGRHDLSPGGALEAALEQPRAVGIAKSG